MKTSATFHPPVLTRGDLLPRVITAVPGPKSLSLCASLGQCEAPGINTLPESGENIVWAEARGANVLDVDHNRFLDLTSGFGVAAVGHRHPRIIDAIRKQSSRLLHGLGDAMPHQPRITLANELIRRAPIEDPLVYFAVSGADAVEVAIKSALLATGRTASLVFEPSYHGLTLGALAVSSRPAFRAPFKAHLHQQAHRLPFGCPLETITTTLDEHPEIGCVIVEPIVGREGILIPPSGWLSAISRVCRERQVLFITDEILTGFGRTGSWFASEQESFVPDLMCCGKALGGGLPIAAVIGRRPILEAWSSPGEARHTATFVAHPAACAAALATLEVIDHENLVHRASELGKLVSSQTHHWRQLSALVTDVRGRGLLWAIEFGSRATVTELVTELRKQGILLLGGGHNGRIIQIAPPLTITRKQLTSALSTIEQCLRKS